MDILTGREIGENIVKYTDANTIEVYNEEDAEKKWIAVDDLIKFINEFQSKKKQITDKIMLQQELKETLIEAITKANSPKIKYLP